MNEWELLNRIRESYQSILGPDLTGIYVHGSLAFGCFRWEKSDIDFLVIVQKPLKQQQKEQLIQTLLALDAFAPPKGFEMSVILRSACMPFQDPTPYELHYSNVYRADYQHDLAGTCCRMQGFDPDLAAHMMVTEKVGVPLCGLPVEQVFAPVPGESYLRSVWYDIEQAAEDIHREPVYYVLNLCRALVCVEEGRVLSKQQGGEWGMERLPQWRGLIASALEAYTRDADAPNGESLVFFAQEVLASIRQSAVFLNACLKKD